MPQLPADGIAQAITDFVTQPLVFYSATVIIAAGVGGFFLNRLIDAFRR